MESADILTILILSVATLYAIIKYFLERNGIVQHMEVVDDDKIIIKTMVKIHGQIIKEWSDSVDAFDYDELDATTENRYEEARNFYFQSKQLHHA